MMKKTIWKDTFREIWQSKTRFLAILLIILLGVAFYVGISATGPDMIQTARNYYDEQNLMDAKIVSNYGLEEEDLELLRSEDVKVQGHYTTDVMVHPDQTTLRLFSYDPAIGQDINQYVVTAGRLPEKAGEIALDNTDSIASQWQIGDTIQLNTEDESSAAKENLARDEFEVVGFVANPLYIEHTLRGNTNAGSGVLHGYGVIHVEDFTMDVMTEAYLTFDFEADHSGAYSDCYQTLIDGKIIQLEIALEDRADERYTELVHEIEAEIDQGESDIQDARQQIADAEAEIAEAERQLAQGENEYAEGMHTFHNKMAEAERTIAENRERIALIQSQINYRLAQIEKGEQEMLAGQSEIMRRDQQLRQARARLTELRQAERALAEGRQNLEAQRQNVAHASKRLPEIQQGLAILDQLGRDELPAMSLSNLQDHLQQITAAQAKIKEAQRQINEQRTELAEKLARQPEIQAILDQMDQLKTDEIGEFTREELEAALAQLEMARGEIEHGQAALDAQKQELAPLLEQFPLLEIIANYMAEQGSDQMPALNRAELSKTQNDIISAQNSLAQAEQRLAQAENDIYSAQQALGGVNQQSLDAVQKRLDRGRNDLQESQHAINAGRAALSQGQAELQRGASELAEGEHILAEERQQGQAELAEARRQLEDGQRELAEGIQTFEKESAEAETQIAEGKEELAEAREQLSDLPEMTYLVLDRTVNPGYAEYEDNAARMQAIAGVFPVFFFFIAILISLTTMTRMVDEEREYIGTMKALGYRNHEILIKFVTYAFWATIIGAILGLWLGYRLFPELIFNAYASLYNLPPIVIQSYPKLTIIALVAAFISTVGATLYAVSSSLRSNAAELLRPKAPKKGTHILLEKIPFIWEKLSFNYKITFRNVFRYKARMFMTIFGIAGSTALILTGFGLSDSISDIPYTQYTQINQFQAYVALDQEADDAETAHYEDRLANNDQIIGWLNVMQESLDVEVAGVNPQNAVIFVPENTEQLNDYIMLIDPKSNEPMTLPKEGVIITQKFAELFGLSEGDSFTGENIDGDKWSFTVAGITANYVGHFIYMTPEVYEESTGKPPKITQSLIKYDADDTDEEDLGRWMMDQEPVIGIRYMSDIYAAFMETIHSLDLITQVLVISAALLTLIVLYNLTNINVAERIRELSTIKVLGFYDREVTLYVYRENFILTTLGILIGYIGGWFLHQFLIRTTEVDMMLFSRHIDWTSYLYAAALVIIFSLVVMLIIHIRLKKVNMVEALKGGD